MPTCISGNNSYWTGVSSFILLSIIHSSRHNNVQSRLVFKKPPCSTMWVWFFSVLQWGVFIFSNSQICLLFILCLLLWLCVSNIRFRNIKQMRGNKSIINNYIWFWDIFFYIDIQCSPLILAPFINMSKEGYEKLSLLSPRCTK